MARRPAADRPVALEYLDRLVDHEVSSAGISAGEVEGLDLDNVGAVAEALDLSHSALRIVHVTGTNGKGTVCRLIEALVEASGLRVGCYMSPEGTVNERIRIDGSPVSDEVLADAVATVRGVAEAVDRELTAFEAVTLSALVAFADAPVDVAVVEVGLLGRFDATNVVQADVAVITNIGGDHTDFREGWREHVAWEKAGIVEPGGVAVLGPLEDELLRFVEAEQPAEIMRWEHDFVCEDNRLAVGGRALSVITSRGTRVEAFVPLHGDHQGENVAVAAEAAEWILGGHLDVEASTEALAAVTVPGRVEMVGTEPVVIVDGAHNAEAAAVLGRTLAEGFIAAGRRILVVGTLVGRDPVRFLAALTEEFPVDAVVPVSLEGPRGTPALEIATAAAGLDLVVLPGGSPAEAMARTLDAADVDDLIVVTGSFRMVDSARDVARRSG